MCADRQPPEPAPAVLDRWEFLTKGVWKLKVRKLLWHNTGLHLQDIKSEPKTEHSDEVRARWSELGRRLRASAEASRQWAAARTRGRHTGSRRAIPAPPPQEERGQPSSSSHVGSIQVNVTLNVVNNYAESTRPGSSGGDSSGLQQEERRSG